QPSADTPRVARTPQVLVPSPSLGATTLVTCVLRVPSARDTLPNGISLASTEIPGDDFGATTPGGENMMTVVVKRLVTDEVGQDLAEYGIALAIIGVIAAAAAIVIAKDVGTLWSRAQSVIDSAATAS